MEFKFKWGLLHNKYGIVSKVIHYEISCYFTLMDQWIYQTPQWRNVLYLPDALHKQEN